MAFYTDGKGNKIDKKDSKSWFHGSQEKLQTLRKGSSITRNKELAIAFSHRPNVLSVDEAGIITHDGKINGYLYIIDEEIHKEDIRVHEACNDEDPWELITNRELKLKLIEETII